MGNSLLTLRIAKKKTKSEAEIPREKGLKPVSSSHVFIGGESVVIIAKGPWEGSSGTVILDSIEQVMSNEVVVVPGGFSSWDDSFFQPTGEIDPTVDSQPMMFRRDELALWDYDSVWDDMEGDIDLKPTSVRESKKRLNELLTSLPAQPGFSVGGEKPKAGSNSGSFTTSRQRKAMKKKKPKAQKRGKIVGSISSKKSSK